MDQRPRRRGPQWDAEHVRALRRHLEMTQQELAEELNVRQQTVSEWETGQYRPRGASERLLGVVAERARFRYGEREEEGAERQDR
jgi:putative transcriptional regulator